MRLTAKACAALIKSGKAGMHADGGGLYLRTDATRANWLFRYTSPSTGKRREMGLGRADDVSLAEARERAAAARRMVAAGLDPIEQAKAPAPRQAEEVPTFAQVFAQVMEIKAAELRNAKHAAQWRSTIETYAAPLLPLRVTDVRPSDVAACLRPIWTTVPETARRVRGRVEYVMEFAEALGFATGSPATLKRIGKLLPKQKAKPEHHAAVPLADAQGVAAQIWQAEGMGAAALRLAILTAARSGEVRNLKWQWIDQKTATIEYPAEAMKAGRLHRVPLSRQAQELLRQHPRIAKTALVFSSSKGATLSDMTLAACHKRLNVAATVHGWRSVFRGWAREIEKAPDDVAEISLAHMIGTETTRAYQRSDLIEERRALMQAWADWITAKVQP